MGSNVRLSAADDHEFSAHVGECSTQPRIALVLLQEIFGVNPRIRSIADDYSGQGFTVIALLCSTVLSETLSSATVPRKWSKVCALRRNSAWM